MNPDHPIGSSLSYWPKFLQRSDLLEGKAGDDSLFDGGNSDTHKGVKGSDLLEGNQCGDVQCGGACDDVLYGGGDDVLTGGQGIDVFVFYRELTCSKIKHQ